MILATGLIKIAGPYTLRSSMEAIFKNTRFESGRNWQNIEKSKRAIVIAPPGYVIIQADQKGADARVVAWEAPDGNFRSLFKHKIKPHTFVALRSYWKEFSLRCPEQASMFEEAAHTEIKNLAGLPYWKTLNDIIADSDNWESSARYYFSGKTQCHSLNYKAGWSSLRDTFIRRSEGRIIITEQEAKKIIKNYRENLFPEIFNLWHPRVLEYARLKGELRNLFGHPFRITGNIDELEKELYAFIPQSTVAIITHKAAIKLMNYVRENNKKWQLFNNCHDSYAAFVPEEEAEEGKLKMKEFMECNLISTQGEHFRMESSIAVGKNWSPYHKDKNPMGLVES